MRGSSLARGARGRQHAEVGQLVLQRDRVRHRRLGVVGHRDHGVLCEELVDAAGRLAHARQLQVGLGERLQLALRARACASTSRCRAATAAGSRTGRARPCSWRRIRSACRARPGMPRPGAAAGPARGEHVGVEQLARAHHGVAHQRRGDARQRRVALGLMAVAPAIHQIGRAGRAHVGVVERLEQRRRVGREMRAVHVVDRVGQLAGDAEALGRAKARAIFDVALFVAVKPVHRRHAVRVLRHAGDDRRGADGRDRGERSDAVRHVAPALHQRRQHRCCAGGDGSLEHLRRHRIDHAEHELWRSRRRPLPSAPQNAQVRRTFPRRARAPRSAIQTSSASAAYPSG